jgi:phage tail sheath protein FI
VHGDSTTTVRPDPSGGHHTPGVQVEWLDTAPQGRTVVPTDVAGFVGVAERGPLHSAVRVDGFGQFQGVFGTPLRYAYLAHAVEAFFANGGNRCWVVRVANPDDATAASAVVVVGEASVPLVVTAGNPGTWGNKIECHVRPAVGGTFSLELRCGGVREMWRGLASTPDNPVGRNPIAVLNDLVAGSRLVTVRWWDGDAVHPVGVVGHPLGRSANGVLLTGGADGLASLRPEHFGAEQARWGVEALDLVDEVSMVSVPDCFSPPVVWGDAAKPRACAPKSTVDRMGLEPPRAVFDLEEAARVQQAVVWHCERRGDRVALLDAPRDGADGLPASTADVIAWRDRFTSSYAALYHPWIVIPDRTPSERTLIPPSGHVAGLCALGDNTIGVHKAPAGQALQLAIDTAVDMDEVEHGDLNHAGVNVVRAVRGVRVLGNRTMTEQGSWLRQLNVRRLLVALEERIAVETAWTVFEANGPSLCDELERLVRNVLEDARRRGLLVGATPDEAYSVHCDESVNPPANLAEGRIACLIGIRPPPPAEFLVVRMVRTPAGVLAEQPGGDHV